MATITLSQVRMAPAANQMERVQQLEMVVTDLRSRLRVVDENSSGLQREIRALKADLIAALELLDEAIKARDLAQRALSRSQEAQARSNRLLNATQRGAGAGFGVGFFVSIAAGLSTLPALIVVGIATTAGAAIAQERCK